MESSKASVKYDSTLTECLTAAALCWAGTDCLLGLGARLVGWLRTNEGHFDKHICLIVNDRKSITDLISWNIMCHLQTFNINNEMFCVSINIFS